MLQDQKNVKHQKLATGSFFPTLCVHASDYMWLAQNALSAESSPSPKQKPPRCIPPAFVLLEIWPAFVLLDAKNLSVLIDRVCAAAMFTDISRSSNVRVHNQRGPLKNVADLGYRVCQSRSTDQGLRMRVQGLGVGLGSWLGGRSHGLSSTTRPTL